MANTDKGSAASDWSGARGDRWRAQLASMEATLAPIDAPLIDALQLDVACRIAEVGCGGGSTALEILRRAPAGSVVHGFDISPGLIDVARARAGASAAIGFEVADAATASPSGAPYDRLVSRFGIMFFDDPPAAFANLVRWLVPGGRVALAVWATPAMWAAATSAPLIDRIREVVAEVVELPPPAPDAPNPLRYAEVEPLLAALAQAGLGELRSHIWRGTLALGGGLPPEDAAAFALAALGSFDELLARAGAEASARAHRSLAALFSRYHRGGAVQVDVDVHIVTGVRAR